MTAAAEEEAPPTTPTTSTEGKEEALPVAETPAEAPTQEAMPEENDDDASISGSNAASCQEDEQFIDAYDATQASASWADQSEAAMPDDIDGEGALGR